MDDRREEFNYGEVFKVLKCDVNRILARYRSEWIDMNKEG